MFQRKMGKFLKIYLMHLVSQMIFWLLDMIEMVRIMMTHCKEFYTYTDR